MQRSSLRVVSYNIHKGLDAAGLRVKLPAMRSLLQACDADLVLLQEVVEVRAGPGPGGHRAAALSQVHYLAGRTWPYHVYGPNVRRPARSHGNALLSRFPIRHWENIDISVNRFERRGLLHAVVELPPGNVRHGATRHGLHVCCTHLNLLHADRRRQVVSVADRVRAHVPDDAPLVVGGDFNDWRRWATRVLGAHIGVEEAHVSANGRHPLTYPVHRPLLALDRIYVRGLEVAAATVLDGPAWRRLSDHLALQVDLHAAQPRP